MRRFALSILLTVIFSAVVIIPVSSPVEAQSCGSTIHGDFDDSSTNDYGFEAITTGRKNDYFPGWWSSVNYRLSTNRHAQWGWYHDKNSSSIPTADFYMVAIKHTFTNYRLCNFNISGRGAPYFALNTDWKFNTRAMGVFVMMDGSTSWTHIMDVSVPMGTSGANVAAWTGNIVIDGLAIVGTIGGETFVIYDALINDGAPPTTIKRPIVAADEAAVAVWNENDYTAIDEDADPLTNVNFQGSNDYTAAVYNIQDGEVIEVEEITPDECAVYSGQIRDSATGAVCKMSLPVDMQNSDDGYDWDINYYSLITATRTPIYRVRVSSVDSTITYIINEPRATVGLNIKEGCRLGTVLDLNPANSVEKNTQGLVILGYDGVTESTSDSFDEVELVDYVTPGDDCNVDPDFKDCLTINPFFAEDGKYWQSTSLIYQPIWNNPGVTLGKGAGIKLANLQLDSGTEYGASLSGRTFSWSGASISISIGTTQTNVALTDVTNTYTIPSQTHSPNNGLLYDVILQNNSNTSIQLDYFCLTEGDPQLTECVFLNADFRNGLDNWTAFDATLVGFEQPMVKVQNLSELQQVVAIEPGDYTLSLTYQIPIPITSTTFAVEYYLEEENYFGTFTLNSSSPATQIATDDITIGDDPGSLGQRIVFTVSGATPTAFFYVKKICLNLTDDTDDGGGDDDLTDPSCLYNPVMPDEADIGTATQWHWGNLSRLYNCKVIPILRSIDKNVQSIWTFLGQQFQWFMHLMFKSVEWVGEELLPWLAGYLSNIQPGTIVVNESTGESCQAFDIICFFSGIINNLVNNLTTVFTTALNQLGETIRTVLNGLVSVFGSLSGLLQTVIYELGGVIQTVVWTLGNIIGTLANLIIEVIKTVLENVVRPLLDSIIYIIRQIVDQLLVPLFKLVLQFIETFLNFVLYLLVLLIRLGLTLVIRLFEIARYGLEILTTILTAWNGAPAKTLEGMPNCDTTPDAGLCQIWWLMDNTIFTGPGALIIPIITATGWILLALYLVKELRSTVFKAAGGMSS